MASKLKIKVNGLVHNVTASLDTPLLYVLHNELHLHGPRFGCGLAQCGACSVLLDGKEIRSCVTPVAAVSGKSITTLEGLPALYAASRGTSASAPASLHPLQQAWIDVQVPHCGYCQNGMMIQAADLLAIDEAADRGTDPYRDERASVPLRHVPAHPDRDPEGRCRDGQGRQVTMTEILSKELSRKSFLKGGGALIVGFSLDGAAPATASAAAASTSRRTSPPRSDTGRLVARGQRRQHRRRSTRPSTSSARARGPASPARGRGARRAGDKDRDPYVETGLGHPSGHSAQHRGSNGMAPAGRRCGRQQPRRAQRCSGSRRRSSACPRRA